MDDDKRKQKRWHLIYYLKVYDNKTGEMIGHMADLSPKGLMIVTEGDIELDQEFSLKMELPDTFQHKREITFDAMSLWSKKDINPDFNAIGFRFLKITKSDMEIVKELILKYFFND